MKVWKVRTSSIGYAYVHCIVTAPTKKSALEKAKSKAKEDGKTFDIVRIELLYDTSEGDFISGWSDGSGFTEPPESYEREPEG